MIKKAQNKIEDRIEDISLFFSSNTYGFLISFAEKSEFNRKILRILFKIFSGVGNLMKLSLFTLIVILLLVLFTLGLQVFS